MNELQVFVNYKPSVIKMNFEELETALHNVVSEFQGAVFTEETKSIAKSELAKLRKLKDSVDKRRKEVKVEVMAPYTEFENKVKELLKIIDEPIDMIDTQLKEMEQLRIKNRKEDVEKIWKEIMVGWEEYLPLAEIYEKKWDNATTTRKSIKKDLTEMVEKVGADITILSGSQSDVQEEAQEIYKRTRDLTKALSHINTYEANKRKALAAEEERRKAEEERRRQQEIERAKAEERARLEEIERVKKEERERLEKELEEKKKAEKATEKVNASIWEIEPEEDTCQVELEEKEVDELPFVQSNTKEVFYKIVASEEELEQVEMAFNSIGIHFERRD